MRGAGFGSGGAEFDLLLLAVRHDCAVLATGQGDQTGRGPEEIRGESLREAGELVESRAVDWDELYGRARAHRVRPQLAELIRLISSSRVPGDFRERLDDYVRENLSLQLRTVAEFTRLWRILDGAGVSTVPFKGFWLAQEYYGDLAARESGDLDLYFHFRDFDRVVALMAANGYTAEVSASPAFIKKIKRVSAEYNFERYEQGEKVLHAEFHWRIGSAYHGLDMTLDELAPHVITGVVDGRSYPVFDASANLLLAVMHHGGKDPLLELKYFCDIASFFRLADDIDAGWVLEMARRHRMERLLEVALILTERVTGVKVPEVMRRFDAAAERIADERMRMIEGSPGTWTGGRADWQNLLFHLRTRRGFGLRARMVYESARSVAVTRLSPDRLMKAYLKRRYSIERAG